MYIGNKGTDGRRNAVRPFVLFGDLAGPLEGKFCDDDGDHLIDDRCRDDGSLYDGGKRGVDAAQSRSRNPRENKRDTGEEKHWQIVFFEIFSRFASESTENRSPSSCKHRMDSSVIVSFNTEMIRLLFVSAIPP